MSTSTPACASWSHEQLVSFFIENGQHAHLDALLDHAIDGPTLYKLCVPFINKVAFYQMFGIADEGLFQWLASQEQIVGTTSNTLSSSGDLKASLDNLRSSGPNPLNTSSDSLPQFECAWKPLSARLHQYLPRF